MKSMTSTTMAALVAVAIAAGAGAPALAQDQGSGQGSPELAMRGDGDRTERRMIEHRRGGPGGFPALVCAEDGGDRLEHALLSIAQRTDPTGEQQPLFDAFEDAAIAAQQDFAAACAAARPSETAAAQGDLVDRVTSRLEVEKARVAAASAVLPAFEAFYDSLSEVQKQALEPKRGEDGRGKHHMRRGMPGFGAGAGMPGFGAGAGMPGQG